MKHCNHCPDKALIVHSGKCRKCYNKHMANYMTKRYHRRRNAFADAQGRVCAICKIPVAEFHIDHIIAEDKLFSIGAALSGWSEKRVQDELEKCQILCVPCHKSKTRKDIARIKGIREHWEHGTLGGYRYCRCNRCCEAQREWNREYRAKRHTKRQTDNWTKQ